jgi:hypothetical protein
VRAEFPVSSLAPVVARLESESWSASGVDALASSLPWSPLVGFEWELGDRPTLAGFAVQVERRPEWQSAGGTGFVAEWISSGLLCERGVESILLEYDPPFTGPPAVFAGLSERTVDAGDVEAIAGALAPGCKVPDALVGRVCHLAAMRSRSPEVLRINVAGVSPQLLAAAGFPEARLEALARLLEAATPHAHHIVCALDVSAGIQPRFGLECYSADWKATLEAFAQYGWRPADDVARLLAWPGVCDGPGWSELPAHIARVGQFLNARSVLTRSINHVKVVSAPGRPVVLKAYLAARHSWSD